MQDSTAAEARAEGVHGSGRAWGELPGKATTVQRLANVEVMLSSSLSVHGTRAAPYRKVGSKHALTS
eukprot:2815781-Rhodomonas_salina.2